MYVHWFFLIAIAIWFAVELGVGARGIRMGVQAVLFLACGVAAFSGGARIGKFEATLQGNNQLKNLTRGLAEVASREDVDLSLLRMQLGALNDAIVPTYESHSASREAVQQFLDGYGIKYEQEIPITSHEGSRTGG